MNITRNCLLAVGLIAVMVGCKNDDDDNPVYVPPAVVSVTSVTVTGAATVDKGKTTQLAAEVLPANATKKDVTWSSNKTDIAKVDAAGLVTGVAAGEAEITATSVSNKSVMGKHTLTVKGDEVVPVTKITVGGAATVKVGATTTLTAAVEPANATDKTVKWSSGKATVATVDAKTGVVTGVAVGEVVITATSVSTDTVSGTWSMTVQPGDVKPDPTSIIIEGPATVEPGKTITLTAKVLPAEADQGVEWSSDAIALATVDKVTGVVTGVAEAKVVKITATSKVKSSISATKDVEVKKGTVVGGPFIYSDANIDIIFGGGLTAVVASEGNKIVVTIDSAEKASEGTKSVKYDLPSGTWGGGALVFDGGAVDLSGYTSVTFDLNVEGLVVPAFTAFEVKLEQASQQAAGKDSGNPVPKGNCMDIANPKYFVSKLGTWSRYTVPLNDFKTTLANGGKGFYDNCLIDLKDVVNIGFWNPGTTGVWYVDNIYLTK